MCHRGSLNRVELLKLVWGVTYRSDTYEGWFIGGDVASWIVTKVIKTFYMASFTAENIL